MLSLHRGSVARRVAELTRRARWTVGWRQYAREKAAALATIRAAVDAAGLDPTTNAGIRRFRDADRELARYRDTPAQAQADAAFIAQDPQLSKRRGLIALAKAAGPLPAEWPPPDPLGLGAGSPLHWYLWALETLSRGAIAT